MDKIGDMSGFGAIVLAGGEGRRLGDLAKPERTVGGVPMLTRVLSAVADATPRVVVGPSRLAALLPADATLTMEDPPGGGPVAALAAGLALLADPAPELVALLAADLPFLTDSAVELLRRSVGASGAVLVDGTDRPQWLCGVWRRDALVARLAEIGEPAGQSLRGALGPLAPTLVRPESAPPAYFDCDTEQDLLRAEEWSHGDAG
jgi:molybdopterin-guanine dinucleotide biosynthesis protein A